MENERGEKKLEEKEEKGMTPDLSLLSGFARGLLLSLHVRDTCLHSCSWLLSGFMVSPPTLPPLLQKCQQSQGWGPSGSPSSQPSSFLTPESCLPGNCRHFWTYVSSSRLKSANSHRDQGGPHRYPRNCHRFDISQCCLSIKVLTITDQLGRHLA